MEEVFKSFCAFGAKGAAPLMDGSKLAKFCRDLKLIDKNLTATEVDIIFSKVKAKTERKITFQQFQEALKMLAAKKYPGDEAGLEKLTAIILKCRGPTAHGVTKVAKSSAVDRLTDTSKYTGTHKERFDGTGKGKGIEGRKDVVDASGYVQGFKDHKKEDE
ncbi:Tubulin polymerization-promoting protein family member 2 [Lamellibrachia satsuma]|nr:Tubulin polymerization-promoting protein family member 2 [Lamellibrachia satsuma]